MHISARVDYGVRALLELALVWQENPEKLTNGEELARLQAIPRKFNEAILRQLRQSGVVSSQRGAVGGYRLDRNPADISIADVVRALDGPLAMIKHQRPEEVDYPGAASNLQHVWIALHAAMRDVLENTSLSDVISGDLSPVAHNYAKNPDSWMRH